MTCKPDLVFGTYAQRPDKRTPAIFWHLTMDDALRTALSIMHRIKTDYGAPGELYPKALGLKNNLNKLRELTGEPRLDIQIGLFTSIPRGSIIQPRPVKITVWRHASEADLNHWNNAERGDYRKSSCKTL